MTDKLVSFRVPLALVLESRSRVEQEHFKDLSELIRAAIRRKFAESQKPELAELTKQDIIRELQTLIERLKK
ncbi:MAG: hypothetical protein V1837_02485 [Candidatus Woesearchaeota archaeon]